MRVIKFRAWDNQSQKWANENDVKESIGLEFGVNDYFINIAGERMARWLFSQYIGVKGYKGEYETRRQNEVELYEGDIVEAMSAGSKGVFIIKYRNSGAPLWLLWPNYQSHQHWHIAASDTGRESGDYYDDLKVIGNIYENPEFLPA